jgi:hypothetical protein
MPCFMSNETETKTTETAPEIETRERVVYPKHWRRTFAVPLNEEERVLLRAAADHDGKPLATWIRDAAKALAKQALG